MKSLFRNLLLIAGLFLAGNFIYGQNESSMMQVFSYKINGVENKLNYDNEAFIIADDQESFYAIALTKKGGSDVFHFRKPETYSMMIFSEVELNGKIINNAQCEYIHEKINGYDILTFSVVAHGDDLYKIRLKI